MLRVTFEQLTQAGLSAEKAEQWIEQFRLLDADSSPEELWRRLIRGPLTPAAPVAAQQRVHEAVFAAWDDARGPAPAWFPDEVEGSNVGRLMHQVGVDSVPQLHAWSVAHRAEFWEAMVKRLGVSFQIPYRTVLDERQGAESADWFAGSKLNIAESCFLADGDSPAIIEGSEDGRIRTITVSELRSLVEAVAAALTVLGLQPGDPIGLDTPMRAEAVAIYLGAIAAGCPVVTIADSFAADEIAVRLKIAAPRIVFTQDMIRRGGKSLPLYKKLIAAGAPRMVVLSAGSDLAMELRSDDLTWERFLDSGDAASPVHLPPDAQTTVLFSSGTTGNPKAIPWDQTTPIKAATDGHLLQDIRPGDVVCWPTNMGWMMGPWLVFAALMNRAAIALYDGAPNTLGFAQFVERAGVKVLGLVPSLVAAWRASGCLDDVDWTGVRVFSSTGECSNPNDMFFLMAKAGYRPIIEYCGGTEIGGGYVGGTVAQPASPSTFSTPAFGIGLRLLDESGQPSDRGEVFLEAPSIGFSQTLLNGDHHQVYYADAPDGGDGVTLRRHGDQLQRFPNGFYRVLGRADDAMNLGGIKVSSLQIEEVVRRVDGVHEAAAIAVPPVGGGPDKLVVYAVPSDANITREDLLNAMHGEIRNRLNPLFKLHDVVLLDSLPRTASNKIMRRVLRKNYQEAEQA